VNTCDRLASVGRVEERRELQNKNILDTKSFSGIPQLVLLAVEQIDAAMRSTL
jgi:hypothetical protein